jgi:hypothetical protein
MRDGRRRLPLIALGALAALIALILVGAHNYDTTGSLLGGESPAERVSVQGSDLPAGMAQCPLHEHSQGKGGPAEPYGAIRAWSVVYADSPSACNLPPAPRYAFTWVLEFDSEAAAVAGYQGLMHSQDCTVAHGCVDWGLGQNFNLSCRSSQAGNGGCLGTWQRNAFLLTFLAYMGIDDAKKAVLDMDARAQQIPTPGSDWV